VDLRVGALLLLSILIAARDPLDDTIRAAMARERVPALTYAVVRGGRTVRQGAFGSANLEWQVPATLDTKFEIASISKMFAGAAARILIEEGRLDPSEAVRTFFPDAPPGWNGMTVRHLITMSTGLPEDFASDLIPYDQEVATRYDDASMLRAFYLLTPVAPPGARFTYSSPNYAMLGMIVSKISGRPFTGFVRDRIFSPAGMQDSSYIDNAAIVARRADGYRRSGDGGLRRGWFLGQYLHSRPDDGVLTTAPDLAKWLVALERRKIVKNPEALWDATVGDRGTPLDYAYGWMTETWLGHRRVGHAGGYRTGFHTFIARYPDDDLAIVVLTNCDYASVRDYVNLIARAYIPDVPDPAIEAAQRDPRPADTAALVSLFGRLGRRLVEDPLMFPDALEPAGLDEIAGFLAAAGPFRYAGRAALARPLVVHGHRLVDYETLQTHVGGETFYVTIYRDASGRIAAIERTN
jgi:CubicO group peptidase (beta-lactamase class C family)